MWRGDEMTELPTDGVNSRCRPEGACHAVSYSAIRWKTAAPIISSDFPQRLAGVRARIASFMDGWEFQPFHVDGQAVAFLVIRAVAWRILGSIRHASSHNQRNASSERPQEVQNVLLLGIRQLVEIPDHAVCLGIQALMRGDGLQQILRPPVVQEKDPLTNTPKRRRPEFLAGGGALNHAVGESPPHLMQGKVRVGLEW